MFLQIAILSLTVSIAVANLWLGRRRYPDVPILRLSARPGRLGRLDDAQTYITDCMKIYQAGYDRYSKHGKHYLYHIPQEMEMIVAPAFYEEIYRAPDTHLSSALANSETMQFKWTLQEDLMFKSFHVGAPLTKLTRSLAARLTDIVEEGRMAIDEYIGCPTEWTAHPLTEQAFRTVTRTANRLLLGIDLARNEEFLQLSIEYTGILFGGANTIKKYPDYLKYFMLRWKTGLSSANKLAMKHLVPIFKARVAERQRYADQNELDIWEKKVKKDDCVQWILDAAPPDELWNFKSLTHRMLHINIAAVHTSSNNFMSMMQVLSLMPELQQELREEILEVFERDGGWTKQTMTHLKKLDSFMVESGRLCGDSAVKLKRKVVKDFRLSDGTLLPKGLVIFVNSIPFLTDPAVVESPEKFDALRMYRKRLEPGQENQNQWVMYSETNQTFGAGKHACPGRFFAANEIKSLLVLFLMRYEFRMSSGHTLDDIYKGVWHNEARTARTDTVLEFRALRMDIPEALKFSF